MKIIKNENNPIIKINEKEKQFIFLLENTIEEFCIEIKGECKKCPFYAFNDCTYPSFAISLNKATNNIL